MPKAELTLYHNPRCSKSRQALALLQEKNVQPMIVEYLKTPLTSTQLGALVRKLGISPEALVRKGEDIYKTQYRGKTLTDAQWLQAMAEHPVLMERPVAVRGEQAVIGRPPENVLKLV